jgi:hypothetical protein
MNHSPQSNGTSCASFFLPLIHSTHRRQRREHRVFSVLLQMVPGLEANLMEGSEDSVLSIAGLVSRSLDFNAWLVDSSLCSFRRVYPALGRMTRRA